MVGFDKTLVYNLASRSTRGRKLQCEPLEKPRRLKVHKAEWIALRDLRDLVFFNL
jgi:hypothetical protein